MKQLYLSGLALLCLAHNAPVFACSYVYAPEPVGRPSAAFIAGRMVDAAAYVDMASPERAQPMRTPDGRPLGSYSVTFKVVERLKGASPDRFTLFAAGLKPAGIKAAPVPLLHWVDETTGGIYPHSTPWEAPSTEQLMSTSCDPGFIEPIVGETYLIFRDADGGLLGPVTFHPDQRPTRGYSFTEAPVGSDGDWSRAVRFYSSRVAATRPSAASDVLPPPMEADVTRASASFRRLLTQNEASNLLGTAGVRPYAVHIYIQGRSGEHRVPDAQASLGTLEGARRHVAATIGAPPTRSRGLMARARALVDTYTPEQLARDPSKLAYARALIGSVEGEKQIATAARSDAPFIYGVEFLGGPEAQRRLAASPLVGEVRPGFRVRGRAAVPQPQNVSFGQAGPDVSPIVADLTAAELHARLRALAQ